MWRAVSERGGKRTDMAEGCDEKFDPEFYRYIWDWDRKTRPSVEAALRAFDAQYLEFLGPPKEASTIHGSAYRARNRAAQVQPGFRC